MSTDPILVCTACGSPSCWAGEFMCEDSRRADTAPCSCEWPHGRSGPYGMFPLIINPACLVHGEVP